MIHKFARVKHLRKPLYTQVKTSRQINDIRDIGPDTENTDHGPDMGFYTNRLSTNQNREF